MIKPRNLLIVRTDRIGDVVLSLPLAKMVKKSFPECKVTFLLRNYTQQLAQNHPFVDEVLVLQEKDGEIDIQKNVELIKRSNFDSSIVVYPTFKTALITFLSGIKNRVGTGYRWYSFLFNQKIYEHRKYAEKHELEFNVNLLNKFGIKEEVNPENVEFNIKVDKESSDFVESVLMTEKVELKQPIIIIHPGSGGSAVDLPLHKFKELIKLLLEKLNSQIILTGSSTEKGICEELKVDEKVKNLAGKFNLSELIALINLSDIFVANSTGPIHIAAALNKYTIGFYPKILACSPKRWGPYSNKSIIFSPPIDCKNCNREQCVELDCMNKIQVTDVFVKIEKIYKFIVNNGDINV